MATIHYNDKSKPVKHVKNLGWLRRHAADVQKIVVCDYRLIAGRANLIDEAVLFAYFSDKVYVCGFASIQVCQQWLERTKSLRGTLVEFNGETHAAGHPFKPVERLKLT